jgi:hypothetical protein
VSSIHNLQEEAFPQLFSRESKRQREGSSRVSFVAAYSPLLKEKSLNYDERVGF